MSIKKVWLISKAFFGQIQNWYAWILLWIWDKFFFLSFFFKIFFSNCFFSWVVLGSVCWLSSYWFVRHCSILVLFFRPESGFHIRAALSSNFHMPLSFRASWSCPIKREALVRIVWLSLSIPWPFHYSFPSCNGRKNSKPTTQTR